VVSAFRQLTEARDLKIRRYVTLDLLPPVMPTDGILTREGAPCHAWGGIVRHADCRGMCRGGLEILYSEDLPGFDNCEAFG
jgi:hypothetical protein